MRPGPSAVILAHGGHRRAALIQAIPLAIRLGQIRREVSSKKEATQ